MRDKSKCVFRTHPDSNDSDDPDFVLTLQHPNQGKFKTAYTLDVRRIALRSTFDGVDHCSPLVIHLIAKKSLCCFELSLVQVSYTTLLCTCGTGGCPATKDRSSGPARTIRTRIRDFPRFCQGHLRPDKE